MCAQHLPLLTLYLCASFLWKLCSYKTGHLDEYYNSKIFAHQLGFTVVALKISRNFSYFLEFFYFFCTCSRHVTEVTNGSAALFYNLCGDTEITLKQ